MAHFDEAPIQEVGDDDGFVALVDAAAYHGFVSKRWELNQLVERFCEEMSRETLIIWATGFSLGWQVRVAREASDQPSFREFITTIRVSEGRLCLCSYADLTEAAQFADKMLPSPWNTVVVELPDGRYLARVRQLFADGTYTVPEGGAHFDVVLQPAGDRPPEAVREVFWWAEHERLGHM